MAQKKRGSSFVTLLIILLLLIVMLLILVLGIYKLERYPVLNGMIDSLISRFQDDTAEPVVEEPVVELIPGIKVEAGSILGKVPYFMGETVNPGNLKPLELTSFDSEISMTISNDYKTLTVTGMLQRFDPSYDGVDNSVSSWAVTTEYPIITRPCLFQDCIVFIDASPSLFIADILTGSVSTGHYVPFYPDNQAASVSSPLQFETEGAGIVSRAVSQYVVMGRNGKVYGFAFTEDQIPAAPSHTNSITTEVFTPEKKSMENMLSVIKNWAGLSDDAFVNAPFIMSDDFSPLLIDLKSIAFITFMVPESGNYTVGLADEDGIFIREKAVICLFSQSGELLGVSVDYESDRPNVTSHFDNGMLYYVLASPHSGNLIESSFFSIKRAVK